MKPIECNISYCFNGLTKLRYTIDKRGKTSLVGKCSFHGVRFVPFVAGLPIKTEKSKELIKQENAERQGKIF